MYAILSRMFGLRGLNQLPRLTHNSGQHHASVYFQSEEPVDRQLKAKRIETLIVPVKYNWPWGQLLLAGAPQTPKSGEKGVWDINKLYPNRGQQEVEEEIKFINFDADAEWGKAIDYMEKNADSHRKTDPWECVSTGVLKPSWNMDLGLERIALYSLEPCEINGARLIPCLRWNGHTRSLHLVRPEGRLSTDAWIMYA